MFMSVSVFMCVFMCAYKNKNTRVHKVVSHLIWVLGTKLKSSCRAQSLLTP